jgi:hypothetical protein
MHRSTKQPKELILDTAEENSFQRLASSRVTGTDGCCILAMVVWLRL